MVGAGRAAVVARLLAAALLLACASTPTAAPRPAAATLRVMTYNIFAGNDLEQRSNLTRVAALIDSLAIDVVFLQEVDRRTARSGGVDQAATLGELADRHVTFGRAMDFDGGEYGIAILTRWPPRSVRVVPLHVALRAGDDAASPEPRSLLHVVVDAPHGSVHLLTTHLDHQQDARFRRTQLLELLAYLAGAVPRDAAVVLGGDLNAQPDAPEVRALALAFVDAWPACGSGDGHTFRADRPNRRIDYVLLAGAQCSSAWVPELLLSDHLPVIVDVRLAP